MLRKKVTLSNIQSLKNCPSYPPFLRKLQEAWVGVLVDNDTRLRKGKNTRHRESPEQSGKGSQKANWFIVAGGLEKHQSKLVSLGGCAMMKLISILAASQTYSP